MSSSSSKDENPSPLPKSVEAVIKKRATLKVFGDLDHPVQFGGEVTARNRETVLVSLRTAGWAPFHHAREVDGLAEPWRAHVLWHDECQKLASQMREWFPEMKPTNKIPPMMCACGALVLVTWLSQAGDNPTPAQRAIDDEHVAATGAMVQNLLLMLTAHGMGTYWSSGGQLGSAKFLGTIGAGDNEKLLAAVFVEYPETLNDDKPRKPGKHRHRRSDGWIREVADV